MPGTIQVSVLEFKGISSSSSSSSDLSETSLKVSMGKTHYQTWDKGNFSFSVTKLSEDLAVTLLDAGGNEIAYTGIQIRHIIQKGTWDEIFNFEGGGFVHLKLQFALNEDERNRIRVMRQSALKKNLETASNINIRLSESSTLTRDSEETSTKSEQNVTEVVSGQAEALQADLSLNSDVSSVGSTSSYLKEGGSIREREIPNATDQSQDASSYTFTHETETKSPQVQERVPAEKIEMYLPLADIRSKYKQRVSLAAYAQDDSILKLEDQVSLEKTPSSVRTMISAFESGQLQDVKSLNRPLPVQPPLNIVGKEGSLEDQDDKVVTHSTDQNLRNLHQNLTSVSGLEDFVSSDYKPSQASKELESSVTEFPSTGVDLMRQSTSETTTSLGRKFEEQYLEVQAYDSSNSSASEGKESISETEFESSTIIDIQGTSDHKTSLDYYNSKSSGVWIFPHDTKRLCITTAGHEVMKIVGLQPIEANIHQDKENLSGLEILEKDTMHGTEISNFPESGCGCSPDDSHNGLVGQVIKVAIIVGFGVLVLLTRKKEP